MNIRGNGTLIFFSSIITMGGGYGTSSDFKDG